MILGRITERARRHGGRGRKSEAGLVGSQIARTVGLDLGFSTLSIGAGTHEARLTTRIGWWERSSPNPGRSDAVAIIQLMSVDRPARPPAGAITDRVRKAILRSGRKEHLGEHLGLSPPQLLDRHLDVECLGNLGDLLSDVEERYQLKPRELGKRIDTCAEHWVSTVLPTAEHVLERHGHELVLLALPETEFLSVLEHVADDTPGDSVRAVGAEVLFEHADRVLRAHGVPYRRITDTFRFEWVGDPLQHELTVQPALLALADPRLAGAHGEFEEALRKRRGGTPKDLEDAIDEAAKSVESILQILHHELGVTPPRSQQVTPLFNSLVTANKLPGYVDKLIAAASGPRNNMASHGQGATVREVPEELAEASIAAAATAITLLAHYLP